MISTLEKVKQLEKYLAINNSAVDPVIETTINKLLVREFDRMFELKKRLADELFQFEKRYALQSDNFYQRYEAGELGDDVDFIEWAATVEMLANVKRRLELLEAVNSQ
jgi:hypothetical protein